MMGLRQKLMIGFGGLLVIIAVVGALTMMQLKELGTAIDTILQENYRSVLASEDMKEALERIDSGMLHSLSGKSAEGNHLILTYTEQFHEALNKEIGNDTLPGELEKAKQIETLFENYKARIPKVVDQGRPISERQLLYFSEIQPLFLQIKDLAQDILLMNQKNMVAANDDARSQADVAGKIMLAAIITAALLTILFSYLAHKWILHPITRLTDSANEIRSGNFDLVLETGSRDEIGILSESFNEMAAALRLVRKEDRVNLLRTKRATEEVFKVLPSGIAVLDLDKQVEIATEIADHHFGLKPGIQVQDLDMDWLSEMVERALVENTAVNSDPRTIQRFIAKQEHFFQPIAVPIPLGPNRREPTGVALIIKDVTQIHEQQEMKRDVVATVSHQLKTPLTSVRMSIHLLLEERIGSLNDKQVELLLAAREDSERLVGILNNLLDINRIESGKSSFELDAISPKHLAQDAIEMFNMDAKDKGIKIEDEVLDDLPRVLADEEKIRHVFANFLSNALRYTQPGGWIKIHAQPEAEQVVFRIKDSGQGVSEEALNYLFEKFYRAPGQDKQSGVGLGLAIAKEIVRAHGGDVGAESKIGHGATFWFSLPMAKETPFVHSTSSSTHPKEH